MTAHHNLNQGNGMESSLRSYSADRLLVKNKWRCQGEGAKVLSLDMKSRVYSLFLRKIMYRKSCWFVIFGEVPKDFSPNLMIYLTHLNEECFANLGAYQKGFTLELCQLLRVVFQYANYKYTLNISQKFKYERLHWIKLHLLVTLAGNTSYH